MLAETDCCCCFTWLDTAEHCPRWFVHGLVDSLLVRSEFSVGWKGAGDVWTVAIILSSHVKEAAEKEKRKKKTRLGLNLNCSIITKLSMQWGRLYSRCHQNWLHCKDKAGRVAIFPPWTNECQDGPFPRPSWHSFIAGKAIKYVWQGAVSPFSHSKMENLQQSVCRGFTGCVFTTQLAWLLN